MPLAEPQFSELITRLDAESGMRRKLRVLANSWSDLRELSAEQRQRLALAVGNRWAWRNVESLFGSSGQLSESQLQVKAFFDELRGAEPDELSRMASEVRQGDFSTVRSQVVEALDEALDAEEEPEVDVGTEGQETGEAEVESKSDIAVEPQPVAEAQDEVSAPEPEPEFERPVEEPPHVEPATLKAGSVTDGQAAPEPEQETTPVADSAADTPESSFEAAEVVQAFFDLETADEEGPSGIESLRVLRRLARGGATTTRADRAATVRGLSSGWAARRAVTSLIRSRSVESLDEALALIGDLPTATQQSWCLGDLVEYWDLDEVGLRRVLAAAPTEAAKRRLERRAS